MAEIVVISVCLLFNALLAAYEMAFVSVPKPELRSLAKAGNAKAKTLLALRDSPERTLSIIQIGITLVGAIAAAVGGAGGSEFLEPIFMNYGITETTAEVLAIIVVVLPLTYFNVVIGELVPKTLALKNPTKIVLSGTHWLFLADRALSPIVRLLELSTKFIIQLFFKRAKHSHPTSYATIEIDSLSPVHQKYIINMVQIEQKKVKDLCLPWDQVLYVEKRNSIDEVNEAVMSSGHTRLPVLEEDKVIGILHTKEFLVLKDLGFTNWQAIIRAPITALTTDSVLKVMRVMQEKHSHMVLVLSAEGKRIGIVTLEDILEEVIGDITDEDDDGAIRKVLAIRTRDRVRK